MKKTIATLLLTSTLCVAHAQDGWRQILSTDPWMSNGYFIVDHKKADQLQVETITVEIIADKLMANGDVNRRTIESFDITNGHFGTADIDLLGSLAEGETPHYQLTGYDQNEVVVFEHEEVPVGPQSWPLVCHITCESNAYAWRINCYSNGAQSALDLQNGTDDGSYFYFFVPDDQWPQFKEDNPDPSDFGLEEAWSWYETYEPGQLNPPQTDVVRHATLPSGALALNGFPCTSNNPLDGAWAIRKDRGPWRELYSWTSGNYGQPAQICQILVDVYNNDPLVINNRNSHTPDLPELTCSPLPSGGGGLDWGEPGAPVSCYSINVWDEDIEGNVIEFTEVLFNCFTVYDESFMPSLEDVHAVEVKRWTPEGTLPFLDVTLPSNKDPKLIPIPKTQANPGLYEFMIVLRDGKVIRHFESIEVPKTISADFAAFVGINVYPVPVKDKDFAIDFDLLAPMNIALTIVDNMGMTYHTESLQFGLSGKNKHVVTMSTPWSDGIYHAVFQYEDGSSESVSFTVDL